jgi:superfamily I DNA/RNA helicase
LVWSTVQEFSDRLAADGLRTYLGTCAEAADLLEAKGPLYRHIVVDEAQDLHPAQWRLLRAAVPARPDDLFIAGDPHQRIYDSKVSLKALGIKIAGRSTKMRKNYRSTHEILSWATALLVGRPIAQLEDDDRNETLLGYRSALHGSGPAVYAAASEEAELDALVAQIRTWTEAGVSPGEIGVSARFNKNCAKTIERLTAAGIPAARLRSDASEDAPTVRVGTMHSFKGLEFRCVAVIGVHDGALPYPGAVTPADVDRLQHEADLMAERCLLFVACTRARDGLYVSWSGEPSPFLVEAGAA